MTNVNLANFKKVHNWTYRLRDRYMFTLAAHKIFMELGNLKTISRKGKTTAEKNVEVMRKYVNYFTPTKEGVRYYLLIELSKFFDPDSQTLSIESLLNYTEENINSLGKKHFVEFHKGRNFRKRDIDEYKAIELLDVKRLRKRLEANKERIKKVKGYRDEYIAHDDHKKDTYVISARDISILLKLVKYCLDLYQDKFDWASTMYENFNTEPVKEVNKLFRDLRKFHQIEKKKIIQKHKLLFGKI